MFRTLFFLFVFISCSSHAQREYLLRPFEDYTNCTTGFLNELGDTIWPAQFERVLKAVSPDWEVSDAWIAVFQGKSGLLSNKGKIILPFEYSEIQMTFKMDVFLATKNQKTGIFQKDGTIVYPLEIDTIEMSYSNAYVFRENGKLGLLDKNLDLVFRPIYDNIEQYVYAPYPQSDFYSKQNKIYYFLEKDTKYGLSDDRGKIFFDDACCPIDFIHVPMASHEPLLTIQKQESGVGLTTLKNETLLEPVNNDLYLFHLLNPQEDSLLFAYVDKSEEQQYVLQVDTQHESNVYDQILVGSHALIFRKKRKQGVLNSNLEEEFIKTPYELRFGAHYPNYEEEYNETYHDLPFVPGSKEKAVLVLASTEVSGRSHAKRDKEYGLINVMNGVQIKPQFQQLLAKIVGEQTFYFAFDIMFEDELNTPFKIYNSDLKLVDTFSMNNQFLTNFREFFRLNNNHPAFIFQNSLGKMGAISAEGKIVIPFIYDELRPHYSDDYYRSITKSLSAKIGTKVGVIDWNGKDLIPVEFDNVQPFPSNFQIASKPGGYALYDSLFRPIISNCQYITYALPDKLKYYYRTNEGYLRENTFYAVKNDTAYAYFKDGFKILNEQNANHNPSGITLIAGRLLLEPSGKCHLYKDYMVQTSPKVYYFIQADSLYFYHTDKGVTVGTNRATANANIDGFVHVNRYPNEEGLVSKETGEWVLEPKDYFKILSDGKRGYESNTDHFWYVLKSDEHTPSAMWTYHKIGEGPMKRKFDLPNFQVCGRFNIARSGSKFGILDSSLAEVLAFDFKNIVYSEKQFFLKGFDNRWSVWTPGQAILPMNCSDISFNTFANGRLIFDGDKVAVWSHTNEILLPFSPIQSLPDSLSISKLLGQMKYNADYYDWRGSIIYQEDELGRLFNNKTIIELSLVYSTRHQLTEAAFIRNKTNALLPVLLDPVQWQKYEVRTTDFKGKRIISYTEESGKRNQAEYLKYNSYSPFSSDHQITVYHTLVLEGSKFQPAELRDLFKEGFNYNAWLDNYLTNTINEKQLFGLQCLNLPQLLEEYKQNFHLTKGGISFSLNSGTKMILTPWVQLKGNVREM